LNHDDSRATNTYDTFLGSPDNGYIRHYLIDFGSCLGSATVEPQKTRGGHEYLFEPGPLLKSLATLGFWYRPWLQADLDVKYPAVGRLEATYFDPDLWKPEYPSTAFDNMDAADAFWAARIVARFSDEMIRALVDAADISDPAAARHLGDLIIERRDKVVAAWLNDTLPLDGFRVEVGAEPGGGADLTLRWENAAVRHGLLDEQPRYMARWSRFDNDTGRRTPVHEPFPVTTPRIPIPPTAWGSPDRAGARFASLEIVVPPPVRTIDEGEDDDSIEVVDRPLYVTLRRTAEGVSVVGIRRPR
jgi:hypothetical protein